MQHVDLVGTVHRCHSGRTTGRMSPAIAVMFSMSTTPALTVVDIMVCMMSEMCFGDRIV